MRSAFECGAPALNEFPLVIEYHHRVGFFAGGVNRMVNVDPAMRIFANAVRVPVLNIGGQSAPIVRHLIRMRPAAENWFLAARLVCCVHYERCSQSCREAGEKSSPRIWFHFRIAPSDLDTCALAVSVAPAMGCTSA